MTNRRNTDNDRPIVFLAFANEQDNRVRYLRSLPDEARRLRRALERAAEQGLCQSIVRTNATLDEILDVFRKYRDRIAIFHYGGHADSFRLLFELTCGRTAEIDAAGFALFLGRQHGLKLVFLNACSTQPQADLLLAAQTPAVIATSQDILDEAAADFADHFYRSLASGASIRTSYWEAAGAVIAVHGDDPRHLRPAEPDQRPSTRYPWELYVRAGAGEIEQWDLPSAVGNPLFGLPALDPMDLPPTPYRYLNWFRRADAEVFFGRGYDIRRLYQRIRAPNGAPIILFYGQSGVGKSSLLAAGLRPRLERDYEVAYVRREQQEGLLVALSKAVGAEGSVPSAIPAKWKELESQVEKPVVVILDQVEEVFTRPLGGKDDLHTLDKDKSNPKELVEFLGALGLIFADSTHRPQGRLILGFRKEWLAEIEKRLAEHALWHASVFLQRLDKAGIVEAVVGPTRNPRLHAQYRLTVENDLAEEIADSLLSDLNSAVAPTLQILLAKLWDRATDRDHDRPCFDQELYHELRNEGIYLGNFLDQQLGTLRVQQREMVDSGLALDVLAYHTTPHMTAEQHAVSDLRAAYRHQETTLTVLLARCSDLYLLVDPLENRPEAESTSRLAHDTLAPLVRQRFDESDFPGQRARRILESHVTNTDGKTELKPLGDADLALVEAGQAGMRVWTAYEEDLVRISREACTRRHQRDRLIRNMLIGLVMLIVVTAGFAILKWREAHLAEITAVSNADEARRQKEIAESARATAEAETVRAENETRRSEAGRLAALAVANMEQDPEFGILLALEAMSTATTASAEDALRQALNMSWVRKTWTFPAAVHDVAFHPTDSTIASADRDGVVHVRDMITGRSVISWTAHSSWISSLEHSSNGDMLATTSDDGLAKIWSVASVGSAITLAGHDGRVWDVSFSPDDTMVATAGQDGSVRLWDVQSGKMLASLVQEGAVHGVDISPDGIHVAAVGDQGTVRIWHMESGRATATMSSASDELLFRVRYSPDGKKVAAAGNDLNVYIWDVEHPEKLPLRLPQYHTNLVSGISFSPDGRRLASVGYEGVAYVWDISDLDNPLPSPVALRGHTGRIFGVDFGPYGSVLATGSDDDTVKLWSVSAHSAPIYRLAVRHDGKQYATASRDGTVRIWATESGILAEVLEGHTNRVADVVFFPDGRRIATASWDGTSIIWDLVEHRLLHRLQEHTAEVSAVDVAKDGTFVATASHDGTALIWDTATGITITRPLTGHAAYIGDIAITPDGERIATVGDVNAEEEDLQKGTVGLWTRDGIPIWFGMGHGGRNVERAVFSQDGKFLITAGDDSNMLIWNIATRDVMIISAASDRIFGLAISPDNKYLATGSNDGVVRIWHFDNPDESKQLAQLDSQVSDVVFTPDGRSLLSADLDGRVLIHPIEVEDLLLYARSRLTREWKREECEQYLSRSCPLVHQSLSK